MECYVLIKYTIFSNNHNVDSNSYNLKMQLRVYTKIFINNFDILSFWMLVLCPTSCLRNILPGTTFAKFRNKLLGIKNLLNSKFASVHNIV